MYKDDTLTTPSTDTTHKNTMPGWKPFGGDGKGRTDLILV